MNMKRALHKEDLALARRVAKGDAAAFEQFFSAYFPRLYRFALVRTSGDETLAEELAQATLCKVMTKMAGFRGEASLFTWLCQICRNELSARARRAANDPTRHVPLEDNHAIQAALESLSANNFDPERLHCERDTARVVQVVLDYLPEKYATALEMKYIQGARVSEIAAALGIGDKAAESVLTRARVAFRDGFLSLWGHDQSGVLTS